MFGKASPKPIYELLILLDSKSDKLLQVSDLRDDVCRLGRQGLGCFAKHRKDDPHTVFCRLRLQQMLPELLLVQEDVHDIQSGTNNSDSLPHYAFQDYLKVTQARIIEKHNLVCPGASPGLESVGR